MFADYVQSEEITSKIMTDLQTGDNIAWLVVYGESDQTLYKVNVYRRHIRNYTFQSEGETHTSGTIEEDHKLNIPETNPTNKAGYTFSHWTVDGEQVIFPYTVAVDTTFIAVFTPNNNTLHFNGNGATGGGMDDMTIATDASANLTANGYVRAGYTFKGWATSAGSAVEYTDGAIYTMGTESEYTLYAVWEANNNTLHFVGNGATSGAMEDMTIATDASANLTANAFERKGYTFEGWSTTSNGDVEYADGAQYTMGTESDTLYAIWKPTEYTITIGSQIISVNVENIDGKASEIQSIMDKESLIVGEKQFLGWGFPGSSDLNSVAPEENYINSTESVIQYLKDNLTNFELVAVYGVSEFEYEDSEKTLISKYLGETGEDVVVYIPDNVTTLKGPYIFGESSDVTLKGIVFGKYSKTTSIEAEAFLIYNRTLFVDYITFPITLESFGSNIFNIHCNTLTNIGNKNDKTFVSDNMLVIDGTLYFAVGSEVSISASKGIKAVAIDALQRTITKITLGKGISVNQYFNTSSPSITHIYFEGTEEEWKALGELELSSNCKVEYGESSLPEA